jgi:glycosyltransferase involved in cell wall biosynthesis
VSVVVPTFHREVLLEKCLSALCGQTLDPRSFEIIVVDDAGSYRTSHLVQELSKECKVPMRYIAVGPTHGPAAARNKGWRTARGEIIGFTDDDCIPDPDWLRCGMDAMNGFAAAAGRVLVPISSIPTDYEKDCAGLGCSEFVTADCFCRRDVLETVGGFDERFTDAWREDSDLHFTLLERGYRIVRAVQAVVVHPVRPAAWGVSVKQQRKTTFNALLYKKHPALYRKRIRSKPRSYYASVATLFAALVACIAGAFWPTAFFGTAWLCLTCRFCAGRLRHTSHSAAHLAEMVATSAIIPPLSLYWHFRGLIQHRVLFL